MAIKFKFARGKQNTVPFVAGADVQCGDYVPLAGATKPGLAGGVAVRDVKAGESGSLDIGNQSQYMCKIDAVYPSGSPVFSDGSDTLTSAGNLFGYLVEASTIGGVHEVNLDPRIDPDVT